MGGSGTQLPAAGTSAAGAEAHVDLFERTEETCKRILQALRPGAPPVEISMAELIGGSDHRRAHRSILVRPLRPSESLLGVNPQSEAHNLRIAARLYWAITEIL